MKSVERSMSGLGGNTGVCGWSPGRGGGRAQNKQKQTGSTRELPNSCGGYVSVLTAHSTFLLSSTCISIKKFERVKTFIDK